jgi:hypothetical protein
MSCRCPGKCLALLFAVAGVLSCPAGKARANPALCGPWVAKVPDGGYTVFEFALGEYIGNGVWRGHYHSYVWGVPASIGTYELQMYTGNQGTLALREKISGPGWSVGIVDFAVPAVYWKDTEYTRPYPKKER